VYSIRDFTISLSRVAQAGFLENPHRFHTSIIEEVVEKNRDFIGLGMREFCVEHRADDVLVGAKNERHGDRLQRRRK
jgi:hypothetical protein